MSEENPYENIQNNLDLTTLSEGNEQDSFNNELKAKQNRMR